MSCDDDLFNPFSEDYSLKPYWILAAIILFSGRLSYTNKKPVTPSQTKMVYSVAGKNASLGEVDGYTKVSFPGEVQIYYPLPNGEQTRDISRAVFCQPENKSLEGKTK